MPTDAAPADPPRVPCVVLAGGRGRRIGGDKATIQLGGRALIDYPIAAAGEAGLPALVVAKPGTDLSGTAAEAAGVEVLREPSEPVHPLLGLAEALDHVGGPVVVVACDQPLVPALLLTSLARAPGPLVVSRAGGIEPLLGRYEPEAAHRLRLGAAGGRSARSVVAELEPQLLTGKALRRFGDPDLFLRNVNTRADLAALETLIS